MGKSVQYEIEILSSGQNAARIGGLYDQVRKLNSELDRLGSVRNVALAGVGAGGPTLGSGGPALGVGSTVPDYSKQIEALERFKKESEARFSEAGKGAREEFKRSIGGLSDDLKKVGEEAGRSYEEGFNRGRGKGSGSGTSSPPTELPREAPSVPRGPSLPNDDALDSLGKLVDKLGETRDAADETKAKLGQNFRDIAGSADQTAGAIGKLAGGLAFMFADSEDAKKLVQYILLVKGGIDTVVGTVQAASGVAKFFSLLGERSDLKTKSLKADTEATNAARDATSAYVKWLQAEGKTLEEAAAGNEKHAEMLRRVAAEADRAANAEQRLGDAQDSSGDSGGTSRSRRGRGSGRKRGFGKSKKDVVSGLFGLFVGQARNAVGNAADDTLGEGASGIVDTGLDNISNLKKYGKYGKVAGSVGSALALSKLGYDTLAGGGTIDPKSGSGQVLGSVGSRGIGGSIDRFLGLDTPAARLTKSFEDLEKATKRYEKAQEAATQRQLTLSLSMVDQRGSRELAGFQNAANSQMRSLAVDNRDMTATGAAKGNQVDAAKELNRQLEYINNNQTELEGNTELYVEALGSAKDAYSNLIEAQKSMISAVRQEAQERERLNSQSITAAEKRMSMIEKERDLYRSAEEKMEAAAQRFNRLSKSDQAATLQAQSVAQQGGTLTKRQKELLESTGLGAEQEAVKRQDISEARKAGFFQNFGSFEKSQMQGSLGRQGVIGDLQSRANSINDTLDPRQREAALRDLGKRQDQLGLAQTEAAQRRAGGASVVDRNFQAQAQAARVEIANRTELNISIQLQAEEVARIFRKEVKSAIDEQMKLMSLKSDEQSKRDKAKVNADAITRRQSQK